MLWTLMLNQWYIEGRTRSKYGSLGNTTFYFTVIWFKPIIWHIQRSPREIMFKPLQCYVLEKSRKTKQQSTCASATGDQQNICKTSREMLSDGFLSDTGIFFQVYYPILTTKNIKPISNSISLSYSAVIAFKFWTHFVMLPFVYGCLDDLPRSLMLHLCSFNWFW